MAETALIDPAATAALQAEMAKLTGVQRAAVLMHISHGLGHGKP